jgi:iron complex outermembrane receptor protein
MKIGKAHAGKAATRSMLFALLMSGTAMDRANAQLADSDQSIPVAAQANTDIIVTGTRRGERTASQSLSPIDVLDSRTLNASPSADLNDKLTASVPSFNVQRLPGVDGEIFSRPAALRNLGPDQTLVLVNGHRRHRSAFIDVIYTGAEAVDLAQIPSAAIGRVEVLRDGASAQYGSDAIAGVINIILDDRPGTTLTAQTSQYYAGDGFGLQLAGRTGLSLPGGGSLSITGDYNNGNATDRSVGIRNKIGQPDLETYHATFDLKLPLGDRLKLYSYGTFGHTNGWSEFRFRSGQARDAVFARSFYQDGPSAIYPTWSLASLYPDGFAPQFGAVIRDGAIRAGVSGEVADNFTIDVSGGYGRNSIAYKVRGSINASLGPLSPTSFDSGQIVASETSADIDAAYLLDIGLAKPVNIAFGGAFSHDRFQSIAGDVSSYQTGPLSDLPAGAYGFPGLTPSDAGIFARDSGAGYLDIEADLTNRLTVGAAGRYEHFSDFGSNFSYKFSARYQPAEWIAFRATYNTGFHAPSPGQQNFTKLQTAVDSTKAPPYPLLRIGLVSPSDPLAAPFGGKTLKPEKSKNVSAGIILTPVEGLTLTADYYHIDIKDRIGISPQLRLAPGQLYDRIQFLINGYDTRSNGLDIVGTWSSELWSGKTTLTAAYNYNSTKIRNVAATLPLKVLKPIVEDARPHHSLVVTGNYDVGRLHLTSRVRYYGSFVDALIFDQSPFRNQKVSPIAFVDLSVSYDIGAATQVTLGAENIFNAYPDKVNSILTRLGYKYPFIRPYDEDGGRWYIRLSQKF